MRVKIFLVGLAVSLFLIGQVIGQEHRITGQVISGENRAPLPGVNIIVKNKLVGTRTDNDGRYVLEDISPQDILVFSYIGYQTEETSIGSRKVIDIVMAPQAIVGEELVVVGYGTQQRRDITGSISSLVGERSFTQGAISDPQTLLQARVPGVVVTQSNGDVGAARLIGIRGGTVVSGGNGPLIVIDGVPIDNSSATPGGTRDNPLSMVNPNDIASIDILKDASAAAIYGVRGGNGVILITTREGRAGGFSLTYDGYTSTASQSKKLDLLTAREYRDFAAKVDASPVLGTADTDWQDAIVRTAISQNHSVSFSSGTKNTSYLVSLNYLDEEGIVLGSERQRISGRLNLSHKAHDGKLRLGLRLNPTYIKRQNTPYQRLFTNVYRADPTQPVHLSDGSYFEFPNRGVRNPVALLENIDDESETKRIFVNTTAEYDFLPGLIGKINLGLNRTDASRNIYQLKSLPYAEAFGRADALSNDRQNVLFETTLNYRTNIGASQRLEAWAGYTFQEFENSGAADSAIPPFSFKEEHKLISFLGRVNYKIADKYLISAAVRREGSSRFGSGLKWGTFPSVSGGWRLSEEPFMQDIQSLSDLKLRVSYGITGNQDIGNYRSLVIFSTGGAVTVIANPNPDLQWEETSQLNLGIDFGLYNNSVSGSIDLYNKTTDNLLLTFSVPQPAVVETRLANAGEVTNKGIEVALNTVNISSGDFFWRTNLNFASNKNEVVDLAGREWIVTGRISGAGLNGLRAQIITPGHPLGTFFGPRFLGYDEDGNEILSTDPRRPESSTGPLNDGRFILGDAQPDYIFGISNRINYKNFDFRIFIQGVLGFDILNNARLEYQRPYNIFNGINLFAGALDDVEKGLDPDATVNYTGRFIEDGSFVRLQNVTVGYTFDADWFRNLRLYLSADNLFVLTGYQGYDPEVNTFAGGASQGIDYINYPRARTFTFGLNVGL